MGWRDIGSSGLGRRELEREVRARIEFVASAQGLSRQAAREVVLAKASPAFRAAADRCGLVLELTAQTEETTMTHTHTATREVALSRLNAKRDELMRADRTLTAAVAMDRALATPEGKLAYRDYANAPVTSDETPTAGAPTAAREIAAAKAAGAEVETAWRAIEAEADRLAERMPLTTPRAQIIDLALQRRPDLQHEYNLAQTRSQQRRGAAEMHEREVRLSEEVEARRRERGA
jgi:hypothetical protein